jgi:hypothetical protein
VSTGLPTDLLTNQFANWLTARPERCQDAKFANWAKDFIISAECAAVNVQEIQGTIFCLLF